MTDRLPRRIAWFAPWTWKRRRQIIVVLLVMFVGYPLSIGPMTWLLGKGLVPDAVNDALAIAYWPLEVVASQSILTFAMLAAYIDFWQSLP